jgi:hypothetical protein
MSPTPQDLVFPVANTSRLLMSYMMRRVPRGDTRGPIIVGIIQSLDRSERILRSMYVPNHDGL